MCFNYAFKFSLFLQLPHVLVNCVECYSQRFLYEHILNQLHEELSTLVESSSMMRCENMNDFVRLLKQVLIEKGLGDQTVYIVSSQHSPRKWHLSFSHAKNVKTHT